MTENRNMTVVNRGRITAPIARNWVSTANTRRKESLIYVRDRTSTKYATIKFNSTTPTTISLTPNPSNVISNAKNIFDADIAGLTAVYSNEFTPIYIKDRPEIYVSGSDYGTTNLKKQWIVWNSHQQPVEISGSVVCAKNNNTPTTTGIRLTMFINNLPVNLSSTDTLNDDKYAVYGFTRQANSGVKSPSVNIQFKHYIILNQGDTVKLMIDKDQSSTANDDIDVYTTELTVRTLSLY